jgi:hypothetical protein
LKLSTINGINDGMRYAYSHGDVNF